MSSYKYVSAFPTSLFWSTVYRIKTPETLQSNNQAKRVRVFPNCVCCAGPCSKCARLTHKCTYIHRIFEQCINHKPTVKPCTPVRCVRVRDWRGNCSGRCGRCGRCDYSAGGGRRCAVHKTYLNVPFTRTLNVHSDPHTRSSPHLSPFRPSCSYRVQFNAYTARNISWKSLMFMP